MELGNIVNRMRGSHARPKVDESRGRTPPVAHEEPPHRARHHFLRRTPSVNRTETELRHRGLDSEETENKEENTSMGRTEGCLDLPRAAALVERGVLDRRQLRSCVHPRGVRHGPARQPRPCSARQQAIQAHNKTKKADAGRMSAVHRESPECSELAGGTAFL